MDDNADFIRWFTPWKAARPDMTPIGWYTLADLEAAFHAGMAVMDARTEELVEHALREQDTQD